LNEPGVERDGIEDLPSEPMAAQDVASAARSCFVFLVIGAALGIVIGLYLILGWRF
jgi:hypothetical protein